MFAAASSGGWVHLCRRGQWLFCEEQSLPWQCSPRPESGNSFCSRPALTQHGRSGQALWAQLAQPPRWESQDWDAAFRSPRDADGINGLRWEDALNFLAQSCLVPVINQTYPRGGLRSEVTRSWLSWVAGSLELMGKTWLLPFVALGPGRWSDGECGRPWAAQVRNRTHSHRSSRSWKSSWSPRNTEARRQHEVRG